MYKTDLNACKEASKFLFDLVSFKDANETCGLNGIIISHPYTNCGITLTREGRVIDLINNEADQIEFKKMVFNEIDKAHNLVRIRMLINKPYLLLWFKLINEYLSEKDFAQYLSEIWIDSENPNCDVNVSLEEVISWYKKAKKHYLMNESEYRLYSEIPDKITVYRGVSKNRNPKGLSYTMDKKKAIWFQNRFADNENPGQLIKKTISKDAILAYFDRRGEDEIVLDVNYKEYKEHK